MGASRQSQGKGLAADAAGEGEDRRRQGHAQGRRACSTTSAASCTGSAPSVARPATMPPSPTWWVSCRRSRPRAPPSWAPSRTPAAEPPPPAARPPSRPGRRPHRLADRRGQPAGPTVTTIGSAANTRSITRRDRGLVDGAPARDLLGDAPISPLVHSSPALRAMREPVSSSPSSNAAGQVADGDVELVVGDAVGDQPVELGADQLTAPRRRARGCVPA